MVADIVARRRRVENYYLLKRITSGLSIPPEFMGLSWWGPDGTYCGEVTTAEPRKGVSAEMLRRHLIAGGVAATFGGQLKGLGELLDLGEPGPVPLPSRIYRVHVAQVADLTRSLHEAIHAHGSHPALSSAAAAWADRLLGVPGAEQVTRALTAAVAELHTVAGWAGLDARLYERAMFHYARALELATDAGDAYLQAVALGCAGLTMLEHGHPDDGLKMLQFGQVKSWDIRSDQDRPSDQDRRAVVEACELADSAIALAELGQPEAAYRELGKSRQVWTPTRTDPWGDPDGVAARLELARRRLDAAEPFAVASVRRWEGVSQRSQTLSGIVLATIHVQAGERDGLRLAHGAITDVTRLSSAQARTRLQPLAATLESRPGSDARELARMARQVAATRA